jgi:hypothetical protein
VGKLSLIKPVRLGEDGNAVVERVAFPTGIATAFRGIKAKEAPAKRTGEEHFGG